MLLLARIIQCFVVPFRFAYGTSSHSSYTDTDYFVLLLDILFVIDIIAKFRWGYMKEGNKVMSLVKIKRHLFRQRTIYTAVIAAFPLDLIMQVPFPIR